MQNKKKKKKHISVARYIVIYGIPQLFIIASIVLDILGTYKCSFNGFKFVVWRAIVLGSLIGIIITIIDIIFVLLWMKLLKRKDIIR